MVHLDRITKIEVQLSHATRQMREARTWEQKVRRLDRYAIVRDKYYRLTGRYRPPLRLTDASLDLSSLDCSL